MPRILQASRISPAVAVCAVGIALLATSQIDILSRKTPFALFFAAFLVSARYGGSLTALFATLLSVVVTDYFIIPPLYSFRFSSLNVVEEIVFLSISLLVVYLSSSREKSEKSRRESDE